MARTNLYQHFCPVARALEVIGEKWSLLIVRDLLVGPARFTDLMRGLGAITPKWLTLRLRELEAAAIIERDQEDGRREVWYTLTPKGRELAPVVGALNTWGLRHAMRAPLPGEVIRPARLAYSFLGFLRTEGADPGGPTTWALDFGPGGRFALTYNGRYWRRGRPGDPEPAVTVRTTVEEWAAMLVDDGRTAEERLATIRPEGDPAAVAAFRATLARVMGA
jgi:DNA-binding HxlR family transcriptional regulator